LEALTGISDHSMKAFENIVNLVTYGIKAVWHSPIWIPPFSAGLKRISTPLYIGKGINVVRYDSKRELTLSHFS